MGACPPLEVDPQDSLALDEPATSPLQEEPGKPEGPQQLRSLRDPLGVRD
jgi:hypothetical protein